MSYVVEFSAEPPIGQVETDMLFVCSCCGASCSLTVVTRETTRVNTRVDTRVRCGCGVEMRARSVGEPRVFGPDGRSISRGGCGMDDETFAKRSEGKMQVNDEVVRVEDDEVDGVVHHLDADPIVVLRERDLLKKELEQSHAQLLNERAQFEANTIQFTEYVSKTAAIIEDLKSRVIDPLELAQLRGLAAQASRAVQLEAQLEAVKTEKQAVVSVAQVLEERVDSAHEKLDLQGARLRCVLDAMRALIEACEPVPVAVRAVTD